jgi:hypothetical protein
VTGGNEEPLNPAAGGGDRRAIDPGGKKLWIESEWGISPGIDYAERGEKMHPGKQAAFVEESGKTPACVSLGRRHFRVR